MESATLLLTNKLNASTVSLTAMLEGGEDAPMMMIRIINCRPGSSGGKNVKWSELDDEVSL